MLGVVGIAELVRSPGSRPQLVGVGLVLAAVACAVWMWRTGAGEESWRQGAAGEQATARLLGRLPGRAWSVWHDLRVPGSRANIDHVVIGRTGVWVVDTKWTRAPVRPTRGPGFRRSVWFGDRRLDTGPIRWEAEVVADRLGMPTRPIVAVHGADMRRRGARAGGVPVVRADRLVPRLRRGRRRLSRPDIGTLAERLDRHFEPAGRPARHS